MSSKATPVYLNAEISNAAYDELNGRVAWIDAEKHISRSGAIIDKAKDYYASVFRLVFDLDVPVFIGEMVVPSVDGVSLIYTMTIKSTIAGVVHRGRANLKLPYQAADAVLYQTQPKTFYPSFWNYSQICFALNELAAEAYANLVAAGSGVVATQVPFFTPNQGRYDITAYPMNLWAYNKDPAANRVEMFFNAAAYPIIKGWDSYFVTENNSVPDANGEDYQLLIYNNGFNYIPQPTAAYNQGMTPADITTSSITATQAFRSAYPGIVSILVLSDLPSNGEFVQSATGAEQAKILTDFKPDLGDIGGASTQYYNANFGDCRWIKLSGDGPITQMSIQIVAIDYLGNRHELKLYSKSEQASLKICFAPKSMVESSNQS